MLFESRFSSLPIGDYKRAIIKKGVDQHQPECDPRDEVFLSSLGMAERDNGHIVPEDVTNPITLVDRTFPDKGIEKDGEEKYEQVNQPEDGRSEEVDGQDQ